MTFQSTTFVTEKYNIFKWEIVINLFKNLLQLDLNRNSKSNYQPRKHSFMGVMIDASV